MSGYYIEEIQLVDNVINAPSTPMKSNFTDLES